MKNIVLHSLAAVGSFGIAVGLMQGVVQEYEPQWLPSMPT